MQVLNNLASMGVKLSVEGDDLRCYAPKGSLTKEVRDSIVRNKPKIVDRLRDYIEFQAGLARPNARMEKKRAPVMEPPPDLEAEAVLDPGIQPSEAIGCDVDLAAAKAVLLTGASGFLGAYLLHDLMTASEALVYCLVRCRSEEDGARRIRENLLKYRLWNEDFASRIVPVPGDLALPLLGVGEETFDRLCGMIDIVFHNGATVNFVYSYGSLKDSNVRGTEEVIRLACRTKQKPLHFISTIGVFPQATGPGARVLETDPSGDWRALIGGYPQSKWVAERLVTIAAGRGLPVRIYRPGFVTGDSTTGIWSTDDFLARMIKGCIQLGCAPDMESKIEMIPVDYVSRAMIHLAGRREPQPGVFHIVAPRYISVGELFRIICSLGFKMTLLPYAEWRKALFEDAKTSSKNALYPLLTAFTEGPPQEMSVFDNTHTLEGLKGTHLVCPETDAKLMAVYLTYFKNRGFLDA